MALKIRTLLFGIIVISFAPLSLAAQPRHATSGDIELEESKSQSSYEIYQEQAIQYFRDLQDRVVKLSKGESVTPVPIPSDNALLHIAAVYLYCSMQAGVCSVIPEAILEGEVINSRLSKSVSCQTMLKFWSIWKRNDFESRLKYAVKTANLSAVTNFNQNIRPRFLRCADTVRIEIASAESDRDFLKNRYTSDGQGEKKSVFKSLALLEQIKVKIPDVLSAVGAKK